MKNKSIILGGAICFILFLELLIGRWYAVSNPNAIPLKKESATAVDNFEIKEYQENKTSNSVNNKRLIETGNIVILSYQEMIRNCIFGVF